MQTRRIVTGHDHAGKAVFTDIGTTSGLITFDGMPGLEYHEVWATDGVPVVPVSDDPAANITHFLPPPGGTRIRVIRMPSDDEIAASGADAAAFSEDYAARIPDLSATMERGARGMHTTDSIDYGIVLSGRVALELDDGAVEELGPGDVVVQTGTRHRWQALGPDPVWMCFVLVGATRKSSE